MPTTTATVVTAVRLSCNHTLSIARGDSLPADTTEGAQVECPKCPAKKSGGQPVRRIRKALVAEVPAETVEPTPAQQDLIDSAMTPVADPTPAAVAAVQSVIDEAAQAPMSCTEFVPGDPDGCARCGELAEIHQIPTLADGVYDMWKAQDEHRAMGAWIKAGRVGDAPVTPNLDAMNAAHRAGKPRTGRKSATKKATAPKRARAAGIRFHVGDRAMPDSQNKLSSVAWQATKGLGENGGRLNTTALVALLAANGITDPENAAWSVTLGNDVTISATI